MYDNDFEPKIEYVKVVCPECHIANSQWGVVPTDGTGSISFVSDGIDDRDIMVTEFTIECPECGYSVDGLSYQDVIDFGNAHKEVD